jgi:small nuclear ribonucleoprotein (snRNP)-like protein
MGRRASVVIPPPNKQKSDAASAEDGAEFNSIMKETSTSAKTKKAGEVLAAKDAPKEPSAAAAGEAGLDGSETLDSSAPVVVAEAATDGESGGEATPLFPELVPDAAAAEEIFGALAEFDPKSVQPVLTPGEQPADLQLDLAVDSKAAARAGEIASEVAAIDGTAVLAEATKAGPLGDPAKLLGNDSIASRQLGSAAAQAGGTEVRPESQGRGPAGGDVNLALLDDDGLLSTDQAQPLEGEAADLVAELVDEAPRETTRPTTAPRVRPAAAPGLAVTAQASNELTPQQSARIPRGLESVDMGAAEQDPLEGSVKVNGVRGARIAVPMDDGSMLRGRLNLVDDSLDLALRASEEVGLRADQRVGELREALADHGIDLGEFDVSSDAEQNEAAGDGDEAAGADASDRRSEGSDSDAVRDLQTELEELRNESGFGYYDEGNPGALINRRL